jgi:hypothetical protein
VKITDAIHEFILYKQSLGMTYKNRALKLTAFARLAGPVEIDDISPETVRRFLDAGRPVTAASERGKKAQLESLSQNEQQTREDMLASD